MRTIPGNSPGAPREAAGRTAAEGSGAGASLRLFASRQIVPFLAAAYFLALLPFTPGLGTRENLANLIATALPLFVVAAGETAVLVGGGIDLSVTSVMALSSVVGGMAMNAETGWFGGSPLAAPAGVAIMLLAGAAVGAFNGIAVAVFAMPAFIVTLTTMMFASGLAVWMTKAETIYGLPAEFNALGGRILPASAIAVSAGAVVHALLARSLYGRWLQAVGHNARAARVSGVPVASVTAGAYVVSGIAAAVAAILYTGQAETASPHLGQRLLLDVIAATVIGGTSLFGGKGKVTWTLYGVIFIKLLDSSLDLLNFPFFAITMTKGAVILAAALLDATRRRISGAES